MADFTPLDNPIWNALATGHQSLAQVAGLARRYPADVSPLAGLGHYTPAAFSDLQTLVTPEQRVALFSSAPIAVPDDWEVILNRRIEQMVCEEDLEPASTPALTRLGPEDVPEMLALTAMTKPGPFLPNTIRMGEYFGIRGEGGALASMAGERLRIPGFTEISAVCTHPDARGRGYSRALLCELVAKAFREGQTPFLHVKTENDARLVYEKLGFRVRCQIHFVLLTPKKRA